MRGAGALAVVAAIVGVPLMGPLLLAGGAPQRPLPAQEQARLEALAKESADSAAATARIWLGNLHPSGQAALRRWAVVVYDWKRERKAGSGPLLAEGVLLDCVERTLGLHSGFNTGLAIDRRLQTLGQAPRDDRAAALFDRALEIDPNLIEAQFRSARIRAQKNPKAATQLEQLALSGTDAEVAYLAAVNRAAIAQGKQDAATAIRWYEHARTLRPRSTAAAVGLSALRPADAMDFSALESDDPFYTYPCRFLTTAVGDELARRLANLDGRR